MERPQSVLQFSDIRQTNYPPTSPKETIVINWTLKSCSVSCIIYVLYQILGTSIVCVLLLSGLCFQMDSCDYILLPTTRGYSRNSWYAIDSTSETNYAWTFVMTFFHVNDGWYSGGTNIPYHHGDNRQFLRSYKFLYEHSGTFWSLIRVGMTLTCCFIGERYGQQQKL